MTERNEAKEIRAYELAPDAAPLAHASCGTSGWRGCATSSADDWRWRRLDRSSRPRCSIGTLSLALILAGRGSITLGDAAVAIVGLQQLSGRLQSAGTAFEQRPRGRHVPARLRGVPGHLARHPRAPARRDCRRAPPAVLSVDQLGYRYPGAHDDALRDVSFELRRGQIMAVVGANGSGKTTLAKLVCDLLPADQGNDRVGRRRPGQDAIRSLVHAQIAPVFQDYARYMLTIRQAIGLGDPSRLDDEAAIRRAAAQAGRRRADRVATRRPRHATRERRSAGGVDLSIGQWQRLAIARALFRDAPVVVLDEPSASLDPRAESELFDLLHTLCHDRIVMFVSHRFATVRTADVVMVLDQGDVAEMGAHDELMANGRPLSRPVRTAGAALRPRPVEESKTHTTPGPEGSGVVVQTAMFSWSACPPPGQLAGKSKPSEVQGKGIAAGEVSHRTEFGDGRGLVGHVVRSLSMLSVPLTTSTGVRTLHAGSLPAVLATLWHVPWQFAMSGMAYCGPITLHRRTWRAMPTAAARRWVPVASR